MRPVNVIAAFVRRSLLWVLAVVIGAVLGLVAIGAAPVWDAIQASRVCDSALELRAAGNGIQVVTGTGSVTDWRDVIESARDTQERCVSVHMTGSATLGDHILLRDAADANGIRLSIERED
ncbi:MAG: hypothetical protein CMF73_06280 [Maricaulis sp.]|nr:hypothetical protein [Maricaulis sp.]